MDALTTGQLQSALICAAERIIAAEKYLTEMDTVIGDGDHGTGMKSGFTALARQLSENTYECPYDLLHASGLCLVRTMGGASGVLFGTLLIGGLDAVRGAKALSAGQMVSFFAGSIQAIQRRGRTGPGDKTMVDALVPALQAMERELTQSGQAERILEAAFKGALQGVEDTKAMLPRAGRAKNFRDKAVGYPDPGAISVSIILKGLYEGIRSKEIV
jgi:dihydroxyacetone kinase-like protein